MPEWFRPVAEVNDVIVVGGRHRKRSSRELVSEVLSNYEFGGVCVEVDSNTSYREYGGGAVGKALVFAEEKIFLGSMWMNQFRILSKRLVGGVKHIVI